MSEIIYKGYKRSGLQKTGRRTAPSKGKKLYVNPNDFKSAADVDYPLKRGFDLIVASFLSVILGLVYPFIAAGIRLSSNGPVITKSPCTGKHGHIFFCYEFRTTHTHKFEAYSRRAKNDFSQEKETFAFGRFLRKSNLDKLPQIINVMRGEMSIVGPKPLTVKDCEKRCRKFDDHFYRYLVKPGMTGLAQVNKSNSEVGIKGIMRNQLDSDLLYVKENSLIFDLKVIEIGRAHV